MAPKRFIKKVPSSGGPPAFKLTLPHQVVSSHLLHLVDTEFELAPSACAQQTWQGSIIPRRNKDRSEYTLQGWKLFAEAHKVKAGDQVSFELVTPHRMVVQIIKQLDAASPQEVSTPASLQDYSLPPGKSLKLTERCSPGASGGHQSVTQHELFGFPLSDQELWPIGLDGPTDFDPWAPLPAASAHPSGGSDESTSQMMDSNQQLSKQAAPAILPVAEEGLLPPAPPAKLGLPLGRGTELHRAAEDGTSPSHSSKRNHSMSSTMHSSASTLFQDLMMSPMERLNTDRSSPVPRDFFHAEDSDNSHGAFPRPETAVNLNLQLGNLLTTVQSLQSEVHQFESRAGSAEKEVGSLRASYESLQRVLDGRTREALRAETGLEKTAARLASPQLLASVDSQTADSLLAIQADLSSCLGALKHSLWDLLVLGLGDNSNKGLGGVSMQA